MASVCACGEYFNVNKEGELCLNRSTMGLRDVVRFTSAGTYQFERGDYPWLARVRVMVQAAGGGSGGADSDPNQAIFRPGGAGGGHSESLLDVKALGAVETVVVGRGGPGGRGNNPGVAGGNSSFGGLVVATGGDGGSATMESATFLTTTSGIAGPTGTIGQIAAGGGAGEGAIRLSGTSGRAGAGGDSRLGNGGYGRATHGPGTTTRGFGGGAGGAVSINGDAMPGEDGGVGCVIIELYG
ncbi:hypothetical protein AB0A98_38290 [Streptomyces chrestomyceticus]|uniref:glycine-rich domain-containing protein n=1 Tax=Streptomyces chrestomyceticus TaxID=68185 RepID=UPI0033D1E71B